MTELERRAAEYAEVEEPRPQTAWLAGYRAAVADAAKVAKDRHDGYEKDVRSCRPSTLMDILQACSNVSRTIAIAIEKLPEKEPSDV